MPKHTKSERKKTSRKASRKIRLLKKEGKPQKQAVAIALDISRRKKKKRKK